MCPVNAPLGVKRKERTKMNENIRVGTRGTIKVGRNEVKVKVVGKAPNGGWKVKTESGKEMTVKNITTEAKAEITPSIILRVTGPEFCYTTLVLRGQSYARN